MKYPDYREVPKRCTNCKYHFAIRVGDSFDRGDEISCEHPTLSAPVVVDHYAEHGVMEYPPPEWCPLVKLKEAID